MNSLKFNNSGVSNLTLVLVIAAVFIFLLSGILAYISLNTRQSSLVINTQRALFIAEGTMFETVQRLVTDPGWPANLLDDGIYTDSFELDEAEITRKIELIQSTDDANLLEELIYITIIARYNDVVKKLEGTYKAQGQTAKDMDIMLVIDISGSMTWGTPSPDTFTVEAAKSFVSKLSQQVVGQRIRIGLATYSRHGHLNVGLRDILVEESHEELISAIDSLVFDGETNIGHGLMRAQEAFEEVDDLSNPIVVLFSDGVAQRARPGSCSGVLLEGMPEDIAAGFPNWEPGICMSNACVLPDTGYSPDNLGNCCSQDAILAADSLKNLGATVFSISLTSQYNNTHTYCRWFHGDPQNHPDDNFVIGKRKTIELGRLTMLRTSSEDPNVQLPPDNTSLDYYKETSDINQILHIYNEIAQEIIQQSFDFKYREVEPGPGDFQ